MDIHPASLTIGKKLQKKREESRLTVEEIAYDLRLTKDLIYNIENDNHGKIPVAYLKGYLRAYAKLVALSEIDNTIIIPAQPLSLEKWKPFSTDKQLTSGDKVIQWITCSIISTLILLVLWWRSDNLLHNESQTLTSIEEKGNQFG